jgi:hypothetical protein
VRGGIDYRAAMKLVPCVLVALIACGKSDPGSKAAPKLLPAGSGSAVAVAPPAPKPKPAPPKLTKQQVTDVRTHTKAGWAAQKEKRWADAVTEFEAALKISDGDARLLTELGWSAMNAGDYVKAKKADELSVHAVSENKIKAAGLYNLGLVQVKLGDTAAARASFATSLVLRPNKTVEAELTKLGAPAAGEEVAECPAGKSACYCAVSYVISSPEDGDLAGCHESTTTKSPVPGWKVYTTPNGHGTAEELLDEHHQVVTTIGSDDSRLRHMDSLNLSKAEIRTVAGHRVAWIEVTDSDMTQTMDDQDITDESNDITTVTICAIGDAKIPTRCALRDAPQSTTHTVAHSRMQDDGSIRDNNHNGESTETALDIALGNDGTVTVKLAKGSSDGIAPDVLGPHKLW